MSETSTAELPRTAIRKNGAVPYYAQLADLFREAIVSGEWIPGRPLPSEHVIGDFFGLSRTAVRQALAELSAEGLVRKEKGRGSFVRGPRRSEFVVQEVRGFFDEMDEQGQAVSTDVLLLETTVAPAEEAALLGIPTGSQVLQLDRLRKVEGEPICLARTLLPLPRFAALADEDLSSSSLYEVLQRRFAVEPRTGWRTVEATAADRGTASLLDVRAGSPLLLLTSLNVDATGQPFEHFTAWYRADRTSFRIEVGPAKGTR
ncbi:MAG: GntR family transcriptional regulator [Frankiales bacterium]|nr:GntR family transcriptional regulator [Frankiales bacterium]